jgi:hypothetical protein
VVAAHERHAVGVSGREVEAVSDRWVSLGGGEECYFAFKHIKSVKVSKLKYPRSTKSPRKT